MNGFTSARLLGLAARTLVLLAAMLMLAAGTSHAYGRGGDHGNRGDRGNRGGGWRQDGGGGVRYKNGSRGWSGGGGQRYGGGGRTWSGGGGYVGGGQRHGGGGRTWGGGGYVGGGTRYYGGGGSYCGPGYGGGVRVYSSAPRSYSGSGYCAPSYGAQYYGGYCGPTVVRYVGGYCRPYYPRTYISLGIGVHSSGYRRSVYRDDYRDDDSGVEIDVTNEPPAGCYYYDSFCGERVSNLDDYTDHVERHDHAATLDIVRESSGDRLRTLEFVDGYWSVQK